MNFTSTTNNVIIVLCENNTNYTILFEKDDTGYSIIEEVVPGLYNTNYTNQKYALINYNEELNVNTMIMQKYYQIDNNDWSCAYSNKTKGYSYVVNQGKLERHHYYYNYYEVTNVSDSFKLNGSEIINILNVTQNKPMEISDKIKQYDPLFYNFISTTNESCNISVINNHIYTNCKEKLNISILTDNCFWKNQKQTCSYNNIADYSSNNSKVSILEFTPKTTENTIQTFNVINQSLIISIFYQNNIKKIFEGGKYYQNKYINHITFPFLNHQLDSLTPLLLFNLSQYEKGIIDFIPISGLSTLVPIPIFNISSFNITLSFIDGGKILLRSLS